MDALGQCLAVSHRFAASLLEFGLGPVQIAQLHQAAGQATRRRRRRWSSLTRSLALEAAPLGIKVNSVAPGPMATETAKQSDWYDDMVAALPTRRPIEPTEVADLVAFLCSPGNVSIAGENVIIERCRSDRLMDTAVPSCHPIEPVAPVTFVRPTVGRVAVAVGAGVVA